MPPLPMLRATRSTPPNADDVGPRLATAPDALPRSSASTARTPSATISGQLLTEDYYVFNKLARAGRHQQHRLQLAPVHVLGRSLRTKAYSAPMPCRCSYGDIDLDRPAS